MSKNNLWFKAVFQLFIKEGVIVHKEEVAMKHSHNGLLLIFKYSVLYSQWLSRVYT